MAQEGNEWKIDVGKRLKGQPLRFKTYSYLGPMGDHAHCTTCWAKLAEYDGPDILHEGYATTDSYSLGADYDWVCTECFDELKDDLDWRAVP